MDKSSLQQQASNLHNYIRLNVSPSTMPPVKKTLTFSSEDERALLASIDQLVEDGVYASFSDCCKQAIRHFLSNPNPPSSSLQPPPTPFPAELLDTSLKEHLDQVNRKLSQFERRVEQLIKTQSGVSTTSTEAGSHQLEQVEQALQEMAQRLDQLTAVGLPEASDSTLSLTTLQAQLTAFAAQTEQYFTAEPQEIPRAILNLPHQFEQLTDTVQSRLTAFEQQVHQTMQESTPQPETTSVDLDITQLLATHLEQISTHQTRFQDQIISKLDETNQIFPRLLTIERQLSRLGDKVDELSIPTQTAPLLEAPSPSHLSEEQVSDIQDLPPGPSNTEVAVELGSELELDPEQALGHLEAGHLADEEPRQSEPSGLEQDPVLARIATLLDRF